MQVNKGKYFGVQVNDVLAYQSDMNLMNMRSAGGGGRGATRTLPRTSLIQATTIARHALSRVHGPVAGPSTSCRPILGMLQAARARAPTSISLIG